MTPEQRLDRLERIAGLMATAGLRARSQLRGQMDTLRQQCDILMDAQMRNEARFERNEELFARLAESQIHTDKRLDALIDIIRRGREENSPPSA